MIEVRMAKTAKMIMKSVLGIKPGEKLLIITDTERPASITKVLAVAAEIAGADMVIMTMSPTGMSGVEPPDIVASAMIAADAIINQTSHSMTHTNAQRAAVAHGARVCNIRNVNEDMMIRGGITADYVEVKRISDMLVEIINQGEWVHITTREGTDVKFSIKDRLGYSLSGFATKPGEFSGLPDGEAACAPLEGTAEGVIVNPYLIEDIDVVKDPIRIEIKDGLVQKVEGGREAQELLKVLDKAGGAGRNIAEFAFGTNPACRIIGKSREDKKKLGTAHIAIGDSKSLGGTVDCYMHMDIMFLEPTIMVDGKVIVADGKIVVL
ncbi:MAG: hypothetical protein K0R80_1829 [Clostridia bacterium]|jgi:leucyl aminopeptidase (aminopeptidase T)|nr:hypothetical protein [Clostridia bacterium]